MNTKYTWSKTEWNKFMPLTIINEEIYLLALQLQGNSTGGRNWNLSLVHNVKNLSWDYTKNLEFGKIGMVLTMFWDNSQEVLGDLETKYASLGTAQEFLKFFSTSKNYQNFLEVV